MLRTATLTLMLALCAACSKAPYDYASLRSADRRAQEDAVALDAHRAAIDATVERFITAFGAYDAESLVPSVRQLYAEDAFLNDRIYSIEGRKDIADYFAGTFAKTHAAEFVVHERFDGSHSVCLRWTMRLQLNKDDAWMEFLGMSQLRFNSQAEIIYHQDYWDFSELIGEIGGVAWIVNAIKARA